MGQLMLLIITDRFNPSDCVRIKDLQWNIDLLYELVFPIKITYLPQRNFKHYHVYRFGYYNV